MNPAIAERIADMRREAARRPQRARHLWIYLTDRQCAALSRGLVSRRLQREFTRLLRHPSRSTEPCQ